MDWERMIIDNTHGSENQSSCKHLMEFISRNFLTQLVNVETRGKNTLNLILTNCGQNFIEINASQTPISDHKLIEAKMGYNDLLKEYPKHQKTWNAHTFKAANIHEANYEDINNHLSLIS